MHTAKIPILVSLHSRVQSFLVNFDGCKSESSASVTRRHNSVIVCGDLVDTVVLVLSIKLFQNSLAEIVEFGNVSSLRIPD